VLQWDKQHEWLGDHQNFHKLWLGPFKIEAIVGPNTFYLHQFGWREDWISYKQAIS
jgi:hypothetical protein